MRTERVAAAAAGAWSMTGVAGVRADTEFAARRPAADPVGLLFAAREPGPKLAGPPELAVAKLGERHARALPDFALTGPLDAQSGTRVNRSPRPGSLVANVYVSALTCCATMTTCPSGPSVTVYQMVRPSDGR